MGIFLRIFKGMFISLRLHKGNKNNFVIVLFMSCLSLKKRAMVDWLGRLAMARKIAHSNPRPANDLV